MTTATPPKGQGPLARREARLAWSLMLPTLLSVTLVVLLPLLAIFWISAKPVELADLRPPAPVVREDLRDADEAVATLRYRLRNSSQEEVIENVVLTDRIPDGVTVETLPEGCEIDGAALRCALGTLEGGGRITLEIPAVLSGDLEALEDGDRGRDAGPCHGRGGQHPDEPRVHMGEFPRGVRRPRVLDGDLGDAVLHDLRHLRGAPRGAFRGDAAEQVLPGAGGSAGPLPLPLRGAGHRGGVFLGDPVRPVLGLGECLAHPDGRDGQFDQFLRRTAAGPDHGHGVRDLALLPAVVPVHPRADAVDRHRHVRGGGCGRGLARSRSSAISACRC
jgi:hypothetical protein